MGLYCEVRCDKRLEGQTNGSAFISLPIQRCLTDRGDNPSGRSPAKAKDEARRQGWLVDHRGHAVCPGCRS